MLEAPVVIESAVVEVVVVVIGPAEVRVVVVVVVVFEAEALLREEEETVLTGELVTAELLEDEDMLTAVVEVLTVLLTEVELLIKGAVSTAGDDVMTEEMAAGEVATEDETLG